ncbi:MAG: [acyl-carrier-protein] S-malonyltransferase [Oceanospirillales bacterium TMED33]|nr:[acyl-carrier-protein] S-malonyltransferase [Gammaproteobacteria bacterium]RPG20777.1 MAG: [acyl-carrier-protein] S-malonyltransferase [Oceanospirillales bacterium TMED33]
MALIALFPGQGSQAVGMLADFEAEFPVVKDTFTEASDALGYDLWVLAQEGPAEQLSLTEITQPLMLTAGVALYRAWSQAGGQSSSYMAGHSLGEYTALTAAGSMRLADAVQLVQARGQFMQDAVPQGTGAMAAVIGLDDDKIEAVCARVATDTGYVLEAVNYNAPGQLVIAGHVEAVEASLPLMKQAGAKRALTLPVSAPFHCALMKPAAERLHEKLDMIEVQIPSVPVIQNVSMKPESDVVVIREQLIKQTFSPVRWTQTVQNFETLGIQAAAEFGPGAVLSGLAKRIQTGAQHLPLGTCELFTRALQEING